VFGVAEISSAGGRIRFSATVAPNAQVLLKCIPGQTTGLQKTYDAVARYCAGNWREHFNEFLKTVSNENVYVTLDLDCLNASEAVTNWEAGRFTIGDLEWALGKLRESSQIIGGDVCGAYSPPSYVRFKQRFAAEFDHPKIQLPAPERIRDINLAALEKLWPLLSGA
jgi:hypothetical protein